MSYIKEDELIKYYKNMIKEHGKKYTGKWVLLISDQLFPVLYDSTRSEIYKYAKNNECTIKYQSLCSRMYDLLENGKLEEIRKEN